MDIPVTSAYLYGMFSRLGTMLAVLAIAVMTTVRVRFQAAAP